MGQFANDWNQLKLIIRQKDDALDRQAAQIATLQKQITALQTPQLDAADQSAIAELHQTVVANVKQLNPAPVVPASSAPVQTANVQSSPPQAAPAPSRSSPPPPSIHPAPAPNVTTFTK